MFRHQVMFVALSSMLLLTFTYADTTSISSVARDSDTMKTITDVRNMMSSVAQILMKHTMGNSTGPLNFAEVLNKQIASAKKSENKLSKQYEDMLKKKVHYEEIQKKLKISPATTTKEIQQKLTDVQATASQGFQKLNEIEKMKETVKQAIHDSEIENKKCMAHINKSFLLVNSLFTGDVPEIKKNMFSMPELIGDLFSSASSFITLSDRVVDMLDNMEKSCTEAKENIDNALKELQKVEAAQKGISEMKQPQALGLKDAHGVTTKDSTSVPSLLSNFVCFAGVMMLTVMSTNYL